MYYDYIVMFEHLFSERGLSLDRLKTLIEVARAGSIAGAARGDSARQSLYSRQIKELEEFFGVELTRRRGKVLVLTRPGWELVRRAHESLCLLDDFKSRSRNMPYRFTIGAGRRSPDRKILQRRIRCGLCICNSLSVQETSVLRNG